MPESAGCTRGCGLLATSVPLSAVEKDVGSVTALPAVTGAASAAGLAGGFVAASPKRALASAAAAPTLRRAPAVSKLQDWCNPLLHAPSPGAVPSCFRTKARTPQCQPFWTSAENSAVSLAGTASDSTSCVLQNKEEHRLKCCPDQEWAPPATFCGSGSCYGGDICFDPETQGVSSEASWVVLEQQQQRLECLQQTINYCEDRCSLGRSLRAREAAARARLLQSQLKQQQQQQEHRQQRNSKLMEEAVSWALQKTMATHTLAAQRLSHCLFALQKHMQKSLPPAAFAAVSTTPGIGGTITCASAGQQRSTSFRQQSHQDQQRLAAAATDSPTKPQEATENPAKLTTFCTEAPTTVLYKGAADAAAARELLQTRAVLLQQQSTSTSSNMQRLLSLESEVRARLAMLGKEDPSSLSENEPATTAVHQEGDDCCGSPSIPEETSETARETALPPAPTQRLISYSQSRCSNGNGWDHTKTLPHKTQAVPACRASSCTTLGMATGEQQWLNLARQVSVLQEVLLRTQGLQQIKLKGKRPSTRRLKNRKDSGKAAESEPPREYIATSSSTRDRLAMSPREAAGVERFRSGPAAGQGEATVAPGSPLSAHTNVPTGKHSVAEARLRVQRPSQRQHPRQQREHRTELLVQQLCRSTHPDELRRSNGGSRTPPKTIDCDTTAASTIKRGTSDNTPGTIHHVRSRSGTPVPSAPPPVLQDGAQQSVCTPAAAPTALAVGLPHTHRLPPMAKAIPVGSRGAPYTPRPNAGQLRPYPPPRTPRGQLDAAAALAAAGQRSATGAGPPAHELTDSDTQTQQQRGQQGSMMLQRHNDSFCTNTNKDHMERPQGPAASIKGLPSPAEVAELLQGT